MPAFNLKIAGQVGRVTCLFDSTPYYLARYATQDTEDFSVSISREDLELERQFRDVEAREEGFRPRNVTDPFLERLAVQRKFAEHLVGCGTLLLHGSAVAVDGGGYLFTARCGTGKSTHTRLWRQVFGQRAVMVNDDKPFVRVAPDGIFVCGSPWSGKHGLDTNIEVPLRGICILERGTENRIRPALPDEIPFVQRQIMAPQAPALLSRFHATIQMLTDRVPLWHMSCNMDPSAAEVSYGTMHMGGTG